MVGRGLVLVLVASVVFGDPGGHGSEEGVRSSVRGEHQGRGTTEQSSRQHKSLSSHPPAFDQVLLISMYLFAEIAGVLEEFRYVRYNNQIQRSCNLISCVYLLHKAG